jgi:hypothetical protein
MRPSGLPRPFFEPQKWPRAPALAHGVPLELYVGVGGKLKTWLKSALLAGSPWSTSLFGAAGRRRGVLESALREAWHEMREREGVAALILDPSTDHEGERLARELFASGAEIARALSVPPNQEVLDDGLSEWVEFVFPSFLAEGRSGEADAQLNKNRLDDLVRAYCREIELAPYLPWEELSYWPSFLRAYAKLSSDLLELASLDWARFQAFISPHDESGEAESLSPGELMLSPSLQVVSRASRGEMHFIARDPLSGHVVDHVATWQEAALVDALSEEFRSHQAELLQSVERARRPAGLQAQGSYADALAKLVTKSIILSG